MPIGRGREALRATGTPGFAIQATCGYAGAIPGSRERSCDGGQGVCPDGWDCDIGVSRAAPFDASCLRCPDPP